MGLLLTPLAGCAGVAGGIVAALALALCVWCCLRRKRKKQVAEKPAAAKKQKQPKQPKQQKETASGPWFGFMKRGRKTAGKTGTGGQCLFPGALELAHHCALTAAGLH